MLGFRTLSCLQEIPGKKNFILLKINLYHFIYVVVRSSTTKLQDAYSKAKDTSSFIRLPCSLAETVADRALKAIVMIANPLVKPLSGPVSLIDNYAAETIREIEHKYPVLNTPTEDVMNTFHAKTKPVVNVMNSVKDTTTSTIQHGKDAVSNVATATVNKASGVADSVFSFYEVHVPKIQRPNTNKIAAATNQILSTVGSLCSSVCESFQPSLVWLRLWIVQVLVKTKRTNDILLNKIEQKPFLNNLPQRLLIAADTFLEHIIGQIKLNDSISAEWKQPRLNSKPQSANRQYTKPNLFATIRKYVAINEQERNGIRPDEFSYASSMSDTEGLRARSTSNDCLKSNDKVEDDEFMMESVDHVLSGDSELYDAQLSADVLPNLDNQETLTDDQQELHD
ncbi:unnamed protein product [Rotaria socialis]|uniref:Uncharacterized protein n=1 Tax=Rotaria socialis TaxID=392032 RepID=A0A820KQC2_9BILA|nr:unnamed protein product [Rotaria socialis]